MPGARAIFIPAALVLKENGGHGARAGLAATKMGPACLRYSAAWGAGGDQTARHDHGGVADATGVLPLAVRNGNGVCTEWHHFAAATHRRTAAGMGSRGRRVHPVSRALLSGEELRPV